MGRGGVTTFDNLVDAVGDNSSVDGQAHTPVVAPRSGLSRSVSLRELVGNPHNPRTSLGDLEDLASIADVQLQPVVVVTRAAFNTIYPDTKISARWVVIIGNRRLAAAKKFGRAELDIVIKDELVKDRPTLKAAVISENVDRKGFDVIEEAQAVEDLAEDLGSADLAAKYLCKSKGWVSQRRALLQLVPDLQEALRQGDLAIREARSLARVPLEQQVARWNAARDPKPERDADQGSGAPASDSASAAHSLRSVTKALRKFDSEPHSLALALLDELGEAGVKTLASQLRKLTK